MKKFTKIAALVMALAMVFAFSACGSSSEDTQASSSGESTAIANPVHECTAEEMEQATGVPIAAPEGAENVQYYYIDTDGNAISQVIFTKDGNDFTYRAQGTVYTDIQAVTDEDADVQDLYSALDAGVNVGQSLAGIYTDGEEWSVCALTTVNDRDAITAINKSGNGFTAWIDPVPGIMYSLDMADADQQTLEDMAAEIFVSVQE